MKSVSVLLRTAFLAIATVGLVATVSAQQYVVDVNKSVLQWKGYKVTGQHHGTVKLKNGNLQFENGMLKGGSFQIDMTSISNEDLSGEWKTKLENHLKSDDFFGVEKYPVSSFVITKVVSKGKPGEYKIVGNLTIKNHTKEIKFDAVTREESGQLIAEADIRVDRADFDVRYGSGSFFDNLGDKTIYDEFDIHVKLVATPAGR